MNRLARAAGVARLCARPTPSLWARGLATTQWARKNAEDHREELLATIDAFPKERTGAKSIDDERTSVEKRRSLIAKLSGGLGVLCIGLLASSEAREWDSDEEREKVAGRSEDEWAKAAISEGTSWAPLARLKLRVADRLDAWNKPLWDPLLPESLPEPHGRPYTLVVDLSDMLVHSSWDRENGWRTAKRPGIDYFLTYLSQFYEIVVMSTEPRMFVEPIVEKLDPYGAHIPWRLFRESCRTKHGVVYKDLSYLGRPLEKTVIIDTDPEVVGLQPDNAIVVPKWEGRRDGSEKDLVALIPFLEALAINRVPDVRVVINSYKGRDIPTTYAAAERRLKEKVIADWEKTQERRSWLNSVVNAVFGLTGSKGADQPPELMIEAARRHAQRIYLEEQKYWAQNKDKLDKELDAERQRQIQETKETMLGYLGVRRDRDAQAAQPPARPSQ